MGKMKERTMVKCIQCKECGDIIYSRARHDYRQCSCCAVNIDGGFDYTHIGWVSGKPPIIIMRYINVTKEELYNDWNRQVGKFGVIK